MGRGGELLHAWMFEGRSAAESQSFETDHFSSIGALIIGRRMAALGIGPWGEERKGGRRHGCVWYYSASSIRIRRRRKPRPLLSIFVTAMRPIMAVEAT